LKDIANVRNTINMLARRVKNIRIRFAVDVSYAVPQAHGIVNVALYWEYSPGIVFLFSQWRKYLYHV
jgi:hypothetical protein